MILRYLIALGFSTLLGLSAPIVGAQDADPTNGFYLGGIVGGATYDQDGLDQLDGFGVNFDDGDKTVQIFGGYRVNKYFAVEAKGAYLGKYSVSGNINPPSLCCDSFNIGGNAAALDAALIIPFGESPFDLQTQVGLAYFDFEFTTDSGFKQDDKGLGGHAAIALRWHITPQVAARFGFERWTFEADGNTDIDINAINFGGQYNF